MRRKVVWMAVAVASALLLLEGVGAVALRLSLPREHREVTLAHLQLIAGPHPPGRRDGPIVVNLLGFYGPLVSPRKPPGAVRILFVGGSAVADWPQRVRSRLDPLVPGRLEVVNGAIPGSITIGQAVSLDRWVNLDPDLVVIYTGFNDVYYAHYLPDVYARREERTRSRWLGPIPKTQRWFLLHSRFACWLRWLRKRSRIPDLSSVTTHAGWSAEPANGCRGAPPFMTQPGGEGTGSRVVRLDWGEGLSDYTLPEVPDTVDRFSPHLRRNVSVMAASLRARGIPGIVVLQPNLAYCASYRPLTQEEHLVLERGTGIMDGDWRRASEVLYPRARAALQEICAQEGLRFVDFTECLDGVSPCPFTDAVHQAPGGREAIAERMARLLLDSGLLPSAGGP